MEGTGVIGKTAVGIGAWTLWGTDVGVRAVGEMVEEFSTAALHTRVVILAGCFVGFTLALSSYLLFQHLSTYNGPSEQRWLIGIIFMVPVYSVASFVSLSWPDISIECNILGSCYEAFAMYSFSRYLIACLGEGEAAILKLEKLESIGPHQPLLGHPSDHHLAYHPVPFNWFLEPWQLGRQFFDAVKFGIVQYMILKTTCVWLSLFLEQFDLYGKDEFDWDKGYPYITFVLNFSQVWALYCLVQFYHATKEELRSINPLAKFLTFKAVVFVTWWQGVIIAFIFSSGLAFRWFSKKAIFRGHVQSGLQDLLICMEMAIAALVHVFVYPATPYVQEFNIMGIVAKTMVEEDLEGTVARVKESFHDVVFGGGEHVVQDVKITMSQAVEPLETGITKINETFQETIETWAGGHIETTTKEDTYAVMDGESGTSGTEFVKETKIVEILDSEHQEGEPAKSHTTNTTEVSYIPESDPTSSASSAISPHEVKVPVKTTFCSLKHES
ncbi:protein LAZ1 homolog 2 isoform X1 [Physcomitrium patens]|uniref:Uncharacterized protein n=3 Tax=Physcomitrium patens TaxID=3218 RepID=A0A2K1JYD3_PHYPA|nr:protein LAZ1-like isoform X1 [Physcomitrium patens]PNR46533.1 hypothetical protein PHYPA_013652 [Physcomitrium patens]|eukprot:XP_024387561.1 protein LAZ1-like isoform X1 [Physcomitrella patens]